MRILFAHANNIFNCLEWRQKCSSSYLSVPSTSPHPCWPSKGRDKFLPVNSLRSFCARYNRLTNGEQIKDCLFAWLKSSINAVVKRLNLMCNLQMLSLPFCLCWYTSIVYVYKSQRFSSANYSMKNFKKDRIPRKAKQMNYSLVLPSILNEQICSLARKGN